MKSHVFLVILVKIGYNKMNVKKRKKRIYRTIFDLRIHFSFVKNTKRKGMEKCTKIIYLMCMAHWLISEQMKEKHICGIRWWRCSDFMGHLMKENN